MRWNPTRRSLAVSGVLVALTFLTATPTNATAAEPTYIENRVVHSYRAADGVWEVKVRAGSTVDLRVALRSLTTNSRIRYEMLHYFQVVTGVGLTPLGSSKTNHQGDASYRFRTLPLAGRAYPIVVRYYGNGTYGWSTIALRVVTY